MTFLLLLLLFKSILFAPVLADLTDAQVAVVKQRLAESAQRRCLPCIYLQTFSVSSNTAVGNSAQEHRRFWNLTVLDTRSRHPGRNFHRATPTHHPR